jgi:hypothetical protein
VLLNAEDEQSIVQGHMQIIRPEGRKPYLGELKIFGRKRGTFEGRMIELLPRQGNLQ